VALHSIRTQHTGINLTSAAQLLLLLMLLMLLLLLIIHILRLGLITSGCQWLHVLQHARQSRCGSRFLVGLQQWRRTVVH
jgi:hypothetical protein